MTPFPRADYEGLDRYDPGRRPVDVDLSDNTNLWGTHPAALARIRSADTDDLARYPELYADTLRSAVSERFDVDIDCVTTGAGSDDVLDSAFRTVVAPGVSMTYAAPTFSMVPVLARMNGIEARAVPWAEADEDPGTLLAGAPDLVYVCRPNNPTGESVAAEWVEELLARRDAARTPLVILDEAYADFAEDTLIPLAAETRAVLVARTSSKAYGLAGLRCGFGVGTPQTAVVVEKSRGPYKVSRLASEAVAAAIRDADGWMADSIAQCRANRTRLAKALLARGITVPASHANFLLVPSWSGDASSDGEALRTRGVAVRPFRDDGMPEAMRVTVGPWPLMERFLTALDQSMQEASS